ncbi:glycosyl hydrolase family 61-domain-containing protein [Triangularia verruculosa]|uniref:lytic cellulose monooxygenase (C4-dehydrogenating) n=1 Tax=Triangularia verruculosa TaxID=2587418 RepID=A0AAN7AP72_9PEZI|nr:glycosyl hydrolase family 61-domain-containing protein [Triangularia verruculosa]
MKSVLVAAGVLAPLAAAHSIFQQAGSGSIDFGTSCTRMPPNNSPVTGVNSADLACNVGGSRGVDGLCEVNAGDSFFVEMHAQPNDRSCANEAIGGNHFGPVIVYMAKVDDAKTADGASASWFKVDEFGYDAGSKTWGTDTLNQNCGKRTFKIPSKIPAGDYLVRAEAIALHAAGSSGGAQFYMSCYQVRVANSGDGQVPAGVRLPGAYSASDPGILINIYGDFGTYQIPGPAVIDQSYF